MSAPHRYLVPFGPKQTPHFFADILVIGAGIAGLRAALEVPSSLRVLVVTNDSIDQSNSSYAQGGIAGVLSPEDRFENHIEDTLTAGAGLCDRQLVEAVVCEAPNQINDLIRWGTHFDEENGRLALTREGGHSHRRIVHALGDATGHEVMRAVIAKARGAANITIWDRTFTIDLLTCAGVCAGALVHRPGQDDLLIWAKQTILASGGAGMVYRETTNPPVATGDGMAAAYRAGAELRDMEFMQFHPTVLYVAGSGRFLITEAVRGEGAYLRDKNGVRFMPAEDSRAELAPRDVVARPILRCMERTVPPVSSRFDREGEPPGEPATSKTGLAGASPSRPQASIFDPPSSPVDSADTLDVEDITNSLRSLMVRKMGIVRDRAGLEEAQR